ncbi:MAG TPA: biotin carboxylase N-terminal domain-containing protein [Syntrophales bacterium]|jgi:acetyl-CoA carboxylase biotin carboxylase subunit|nr:biotin carboxylase N-terminal domain-containing protein [Syntrophales bacterium]HON23270.1 biotin carboxylase N-terminal domain-containing protein [Syntrophales bacterium]HOU78461.1 biotin carboxylase N-terminal domain-containing protein [Syntrophales bacterium]HPC33308.1 biotin carboxylase N-terminal domain-containing protein [Syntrophales bacterium]HQG34860.1 biotin carboxylase N-terminal domain-containing protein [Syntrophales bacterium]
MKKIQRVLVANRGEIALRIIRTVRDMNLEAIAIYEKPDRDAYFHRFANRVIQIGEVPMRGYLDIERIVTAAVNSGADAVHPGYGFLAENADFAEACGQAGLIFIGPPPAVIRDLGNKVFARRLMQEAGIPVVPGTESLPPGREGVTAAAAFGDRAGYPIILKATAGGGGRGVRRIDNERELKLNMAAARAEALAAFHDDRLYAEKYIEAPRHVEVQIMADHYGHVVHLGTRDCSIQRRHQKLLEIAPADLPGPVIDNLHQAAVKAAKVAGYVNAGTVEFLVDSRTNEFWFMEVNTRLQVEHTVTEMITGEDLVQEQIRIAEGRPLQIRQEEVRLHGIAIEVRINAEDPKNNFLPEGGKLVEVYHPPGGTGIRVDGNVYKGYVVPSVYDSLLAKLIVWGYEWEQTVNRLQRALKDFTIVWPKTTIPLYLAICEETDFRNRKFDTGYLDTHPDIFKYPDAENYVFEEAVYNVMLTPYEGMEGQSEEEQARNRRPGWWMSKRTLTVREIEELKKEGIFKSAIKGKVTDIRVEVGDEVMVGDVLLDLEAMKMHTHVICEVDGRVADILIEPGDAVDVGDTLVMVTANR